MAAKKRKPEDIKKQIYKELKEANQHLKNAWQTLSFAVGQMDRILELLKELKGGDDTGVLQTKIKKR